jgi:hypothetical protein
MMEDQFDTCWKCAAVPKQVGPSKEHLTMSFFPLALVMAVLAPALADCIHSASIVSSGIRFYNAPLERIATLAFWIFLVIRATITFFAAWYFARRRFKHMLVWCCFVVLWLWIDAQMDVAVK